MSYRKSHLIDIRVSAELPEPPIVPTERNYVSYSNSETARSRRNNIMLNELSTDIGYPQQILVSLANKEAAKNYMRLNIKKMKDFTPATVDLNRIDFVKSQRLVEAKDILDIKKEEMIKKDMTKLNLKKEQLIHTVHVQPKMTKMEKAFEKTRNKGESVDRCNTYRDTTDKERFKKYTESYLLKRSVTKKKMIYYKVFGEEEETGNVKNKNKKNIQTKTDPKSVSRVKPKSNTNPVSENDRKKFTQLVNKLEYYDKIVTGKMEENQLKVHIDVKVQAQEDERIKGEQKQKRLIENVKNMNTAIKDTYLKKLEPNLNSLKDLQRIDPIFSKELKALKFKKLKNMRRQLESASSRPSALNTKTIPQKLVIDTNFNTLQDSSSVGNASESFFATRPAVRIKRIRDFSLQRYEKLRYFLRNLFYARDEALRFGIPYKDLYYAILEQKKKQYSLEGSYLFYKAIKQEHLETVRSFVHENHIILYERDQQYRTPLILACQLNSTQIASFLIDSGSNLDAISFKRKNSLYYAVKHNNEKIVRQLLFKGASPWSEKGFDFGSMTLTDRIKRMLGKARKISIALKISKSINRKDIWQSLKNRIIDDQQF